MKLISRYTKVLRVAIICSVISSSAVLTSMFDIDDSKEIFLKVFASSLFWVGLILEQIFIWKSNKLRKSIEKSQSGRTPQGLPGICSFFKTKVGFIVDIVFILSIIIYIVLSIGNWGIRVAQYIFLFLIVLSFRLHCITNGKNYKYKLYLQRRRAKS